MIINYAELCAKKTLETLLKTDPVYSDICKCEHCMDDILAKALNNITPSYITSKTGEVYAEYNSLDTQNNVEVVREIVKAIEFISTHRRHS